MTKSLLSTAAVILTFIAFVPYIHAIVRGTARPHVISWVIWGISTCVVFFAQWHAKGGVGAIPIGISGSITLLIALLAYLHRADDSITVIDWCFLIAALSALPLWYVTANPLWTVVILTFIDLMGFGPTLRKACQYPQQESVLFYGLFLVRNLLAAAALETYSLTTVLFPLSIALACFVLIILILLTRRRNNRCLHAPP